MSRLLLRVGIGLALVGSGAVAGFVTRDQFPALFRTRPSPTPPPVASTTTQAPPTSTTPIVSERDECLSALSDLRAAANEFSAILRSTASEAESVKGRQAKAAIYSDGAAEIVGLQARIPSKAPEPLAVGHSLLSQAIASGRQAYFALALALAAQDRGATVQALSAYLEATSLFDQARRELFEDDPC